MSGFSVRDWDFDLRAEGLGCGVFGVRPSVSSCSYIHARSCPHLCFIQSGDMTSKGKAKKAVGRSGEEKDSDDEYDDDDEHGKTRHV